MSQPLIPIDSRLPDDAAFMARTELSQLRRLGMREMNLDTITGHLLGVLGQRPSVRHQSCVTEEILGLLTSAGLQIEEDIRIYRDPDEAERLADDLVAEGFRLFGPYPLREGRFAPEAQLVSANLWRALNSKRNLADLVPPEHLAPRHILSWETLPQLPPCGVYLKFAGAEATGSGFCVRHCPDKESFARALDWFRDEGCTDDLLVEHAVDTVATWCANVVVTPEATHYLGAAGQVLSAPGQQSGSIIDPKNPLPEAGANLAICIGEAARSRGFLGVAGFDIGLASDGRLLVFDPNFRFNACTGQILLHSSAASRAGLSVSLSFNLTSELSMQSVMRRLAGPIADGWLVPTRLVDGRLLPDGAPSVTCTGFVLGKSEEMSVATLKNLEIMISQA